MKEVKLKRGKEKPVLNKHHWIFSGAIEYAPDYEDGDILGVRDYRGNLLGAAYFNKRTSISGRMISFGNIDYEKILRESIQKAFEFRVNLFDEDTTAYRLINSEGDNLPGLVVDRYGDILVVQISTLGMEKLKPIILDELIKIINPTVIYEKSNLPSRKEEGLQNKEGILYGDSLPKEVIVKENNINFVVDIRNGQKTGFFLDQREMRRLVGEIAVDKRVLNCFGYTGGFSLYAAKGGARKTTTVDISSEAVELAEKNFSLNKFKSKNDFLAEDVFEFLRHDDLSYDLIILDPPAFAKRKKDINQACRGYKEINRLALEKMPMASFLLTSSCSYFVDEKLFQTVVFQAAVEAKRKVRIIGRHHLAPDHPINIFHPEGDYLKSLLLFVE